jgi:hypothetical protein
MLALVALASTEKFHPRHDGQEVADRRIQSAPPGGAALWANRRLKCSRPSIRRYGRIVAVPPDFLVRRPVTDASGVTVAILDGVVERSIHIRAQDPVAILHAAIRKRLGTHGAANQPTARVRQVERDRVLCHNAIDVSSRSCDISCAS